MTKPFRTALPLVLAGAVLVPAVADAAVTSTRSASSVAKAIASKPSLVRSASWVNLPSKGKPAAISTTKLVGFPRSGNSFAVLSTGDATAIDDPNDEPDLSHANGPRSRVVRGTRDTVILKVNVNVPRGANCLSVRFRFLSEEFDEFVGEEFNDGFLTELGPSTWSSKKDDPAIKAPNNFAFDREKKRITVNSTGDFSVTASRAKGTTYDAGTRRLRASAPVKPGRRTVHFSIFDQGDRQYDSTVVLDALNASRRVPCKGGALLD